MSESFTIDDIYKLFQASQREADRRSAEAEKRLAKVEDIAANTNKAVGNLTNRWGDSLWRI